MSAKLKIYAGAVQVFNASSYSLSATSLQNVSSDVVVTVDSGRAYIPLSHCSREEGEMMIVSTGLWCIISLIVIMPGWSVYGGKVLAVVDCPFLILSVMMLKSLKLSLTISVTLILFICYFTKEAHHRNI